MLTLFIVLILQFEPAEGAGETGYEALKFGEDANSYISFTPDMSPFQNALSVCSWVRKLGQTSHPVVFSYSSSEILTSDNGGYNRFFSSSSLDNLKSKFTATQGEWFHQCHTWSLLKRRFSVYFNGQFVASHTTPSGRALNTGGRLTIGNYGNGGHAHLAFGGELYQLNVYSKELSASEVRDMAAGGLCSGGEDLHDDTRQLKWEEILQKTRTGNVLEVELDTITMTCKPAKDLRETKRKLNQTEEQLNKTANELKDTKQQLNSTAHELDEATKQLETITQWDLLYFEPFFNNVFTKDLYMKLSSSWDIVEDFVGVNITAGLISHFKHCFKNETSDPDE